MDRTETEAPETDSRALRIGLIQLVFVIVVIAGAIGMSRALKGGVEERAPQISDLRGQADISVRMVDIRSVDYLPQVNANGTIQASAEISVTPQVSGEIKRVNPTFRAGALVKRGDVLFEIDRADYLLAVQKAEAEIASANSDLLQLRAEADLARQEWIELYPGREINSLAARVPQIDAALARLGTAEANKQTAELALRRTRVSMPVDALVLSSSLEVGQIVSPGQTLGRMVGVDSIEVVVPVSNDQLSALQPVIGRSAEIRGRTARDNPVNATVVRVDASVDPRTRLSSLYLRPETQTGVRIGDFVEASLRAELVSGAIVLPASALISQSDVWVVEQGILASRNIRVLGEGEDGDTVIAAPFDIADGVVALPPLEALVGQSVSIRPSDPRSASTGGQADGGQ